MAILQGLGDIKIRLFRMIKNVSRETSIKIVFNVDKSFN